MNIFEEVPLWTGRKLKWVREPGGERIREPHKYRVLELKSDNLRGVDLPIGVIDQLDRIFRKLPGRSGDES
jgi:hypothetical protein